MPRRSEFVLHLLDLLAPWHPVEARSMFGGWGFFREGRMFALVASETFYVKVDAVSRSEFVAAGLVPFSYDTKAGPRTLDSYFTMPEAALDSPSALALWAQKGWDAAVRSAKPPKPPRPTAKASAARPPRRRA